MKPNLLLLTVGSIGLLAGCSTVPTGPSMLVLPGTTKNFDQFRNDDAACRHYALNQTTAANQSANDESMRNAAVGTAIGAIAGAAIGGRQGAAVGAGGGLIIGSASGSEAARYGSYGAQRQYDHAYIQCMYAAGHRVPVAGGMTGAPAESKAPPPPPPPSLSAPPPPPPPPPSSPR